MELLQGLSDDQTALLGCAAALALCGGLLAASTLLGRAARRDRSSRTESAVTLRIEARHGRPEAQGPAARRSAA